MSGANGQGLVVLCDLQVTLRARADLPAPTAEAVVTLAEAEIRGFAARLQQLIHEAEGLAIDVDAG